MAQHQHETFELLISKHQRKSYPVTVTRSQAGEANAKMRVDLESAPLLDWLRQIRMGDLSAANTIDLGKFLFQRLFTEQINILYRSAISQARATSKSLRICLRIEPPELAALPWELLYDETEDAFLSISADTPLSRYIPLQTQVRALETALPLQILVVISHPRDLSHLNVDIERSMILDAWQVQIQQGQVQIHFVDHATPANITQALRTIRPQVFHFIGHANFQDHQAQIALEVEDKETWNKPFRLMDDQTFREFFSGVPETRLVVLNACQSGQTSSSKALAGLAPLLLQRQITAVVAMQYPIEDHASIIFAREFYRSLALGYPVDAAVAEARKGLYIERGAGSRDWLTPVLFMRAQDGQLFQMQQATEPGPSASPTHEKESPPAALSPTKHPALSGPEAAGLPRITPKLYNRIRQALLECDEFTNDRALRALFADPRLQPWQKGLPEADSLANRVEYTLSYLQTARNRLGESALVLMLQVLNEHKDPATEIKNRLAALAEEF